MRKLQALKEGALQPMHDVCTERDKQNCIIEKCTSLALVKMVAEHNKALTASPEVFEARAMAYWTVSCFYF